jgi:excisionase family DNA binding protein
LKRPVPRITLTRAEAANSLGMSVDHFERHVQPELRVVRSGRLVLVPVAELEKWSERNAELVLSGAEDVDADCLFAGPPPPR